MSNSFSVVCMRGGFLVLEVYHLLASMGISIGSKRVGWVVRVRVNMSGYSSHNYLKCLIRLGLPSISDGIVSSSTLVLLCAVFTVSHERADSFLDTVMIPYETEKTNDRVVSHLWIDLEENDFLLVDAVEWSIASERVHWWTFLRRCAAVQHIARCANSSVWGVSSVSFQSLRGTDVLCARSAIGGWPVAWRLC